MEQIGGVSSALRLAEATTSAHERSRDVAPPSEHKTGPVLIVFEAGTERDASARFNTAVSKSTEQRARGKPAIARE